MTTNAELQARRQAAVPRGVANAFSYYMCQADNATLTDAEGRQYIDFAGGIAVLNVGHRHPRVMAAVAAQLQQLTHAAFQVSPYENYLRLAERLNTLAPGTTPKKTIFFTTGAEAVENAVKIARLATQRRALIAFSGGFHGRTLATLALTGKVQPYKAGCGPLPGDVYRAPYPMAFHGVSIAASLAAIAQIFRCDVDPREVAAIVLEPVLGEGGFYSAPPEFLRALRALCDLHGILLIADEIQTGFARTGRMFAVEHADVEPDLLVVAKSLGGGLPLSGVIGKAAIMDAPGPGTLGGTYGGSPLACAAALAVLDVIHDEQLCERAVLLGGRVRRHFEALQKSGARIGEVRALGAMVAMEFVREGDPLQPDADHTKAVVQAAGRRGLIILSCGLYGNVIRFLAPLTIPDAQLLQGLEILEAAAREVA
jgi:4-aminobutyrate aminotransferase